MNIYQTLPNAKKYGIAIDERGIVLEGPVDPQCYLTFKDICLIYYATDKMVDAFLEDKFKEKIEKGINKERDNTQAIFLLDELYTSLTSAVNIYPSKETALAAKKARDFLYPFHFGEDE